MPFWTFLKGITVTTLAVTVTHSISATPASMVVRIVHRASTGTVPVGYLNLGTNTVDVCSSINTAVLVDIEVQVIPPSSVVVS